MADVAHELAGQVFDRGENTAGNDLALDFGEPEFDLVEPGRVGRGEVQVDLRMGLEELRDLLGFVGREIVGDDVDLPARGWLATSSARKATNSWLV